MRVFIAAIDGLEYNLVVKWDMKTFMQKKFGVHDVTVSVKPGEPLYTPLIWASFLLGEPAYKYGFDMDYIESRKAEYGYNIILRYLFKIRKTFLKNKRLGLREFLAKKGIFDINNVKRQSHKIEVMPDSLLARTFIAECKKRGLRVLYKNIPSMPNDKYSRYRAYLFEYFNSEFNKRIEILNELYSETQKDLYYILNNINKYDLIIYYTPLIDEAHHMLYRPGKLSLMVRLRQYYGLVEKQVSLIKENLDRNDLLLIVSDHGYDPNIHEHSNYGFWSSNLPLDPEPRRITDFRWIVERFLCR